MPADRIAAVSELVKITESELAALDAFASERGYRRVILVTSPRHARRGKIIGNRQLAEIASRASSSRRPRRTFRERRVAEAVVHEYLGIAALYLGLSPLLR